MVIIILFGFLAVFFAFLCQKKKIAEEATNDKIQAYRYENFSKYIFVISFLCLAIPCFLCAEGTDMHVYVELYQKWKIADLKDLSFEAGYILLNLILKIFIKNAYIGLGVIKILSLFLIYKSLYMLRDKINIGLAVCSYVVLLYIFNYHLLRMMLALGIVFLVLAYEIVGKSQKAVIGLIIAFFFHYTSLIVLITYLIYKVMGKEIKFTKVMVFSAGLLILYGSAIPIMQNMVSNIPFFDKYSTYLDNARNDVGIVQLILFIPILYILSNTFRKGKRDKFYLINTLFGIMLFFTGALGYLLPVISRTVYYFYWFVVTFFAASPLIKDRFIFVIGKMRINSITMFSILYLVLQAVIMYRFNNAFQSNGLMQYSLW